MDKAKYSEASKARWAKVAPQERSERMRLLIAKRWSKMTPAQRKAHHKKLMASRWPIINKPIKKK